MATRTRNRNTVETGSSTNLVATTGTRVEGPVVNRTQYIHGYPFPKECVDKTYQWNSDYASYYSKVGVDESMTDEVGDYDQYNPCLHVKDIWNFPGLDLAEHGTSVDAYGCTTETETTGLVSAGPANGNIGVNSFPSWDSDYNAMLRTLSGHEFGIQSSDTNLPTFLGELRDFKTLFSAVGGWLTPKPNKRGSLEWNNLYRQLRRYEPEPLKNAAGFLAKTDLFWNFAAKPFIQDVKNLMIFGQHMQNQWDRLKSPEPLVSRSTVHDDGNLSYDWFPNPSVHNRRIDIEYTREVTSYVKYQIDTDALIANPPHKYLAAADALGFDEPLKAAWELTPWSFAIDYFVHVGNFLDQFKGNLIDIPHTKLEQGYSVKRVAHSRTITHFDVGYNRTEWTNGSGGFEAIGTREKVHYQRFVQSLPFGVIAAPQVRMPNLRQIRLLSDIFFLKGLASSR